MILVWVWIASFVATIPTWRLPLDHHDQALFRFGSSILRRGGELYRDIWDVKQPGIYWYYTWAEGLFGTGARFGGVHVLSSIWLSTAAVLSAWIVRRAFPSSRAWLFAPFATLGLYTFRVNAFSYAQVEGLIVLPILAVIACVAAASEVRGRARLGLYFAAGALAGVAATFKLLLVVIPGMVILIGLAGIARSRRPVSSKVGDDDAGGFTMAVADFCAALAGGIVVLAAVTTPFVLSDRLDVFLWTNFVFPREAIASVELPGIGKLLESAAHLGTTVVLLLPAAAVGLAKLRRSSSPFARVAGSGCVTWIVIGLIAIVAQRFSWHAYHFTMLIWPVGVLATAGLVMPISPDRAERPLAGAGRVTRVVTALAIGGVLINGARFAYRQVYPFPTEIDTSTYLEELPGLSSEIEGSTCRTAIVFGGPALLIATGLSPVSRLTGQLAVVLVSTQWDELASTLMERKPQFVYFSTVLRPVVRQNSPELYAWIERHYRLIAEDSLDGVWLSYAGERPASDCRAQVSLDR